MNLVDFSYDDSQFLYEPYPVGLVRNVVPGDAYRELVDAWPATELFEFKPVLGNKYSLSEVNNPREYHQFVRSCLPWRRFHAYIKGRDFLYGVIAMLYARHIDLGLGGNYLTREQPPLRAIEKLKVLVKTRRLSARFEFSMLPAAGGYIKPHTDAPQKIVTLVIAVMPPGEWDAAVGGGTEILRPRDITRNYNYLNRQFEFADVETLATFPFEPNQAVIFVKTFNSWHAVHPIRGEGSAIMRKTVTINIEAK
jgi:hypothetical protein